MSTAALLRDPLATRRVVVPAADRVAVQDHLCGLASADQVLHRAGLTLRAQSANRPEVSVTLTNDVIQRAVNSFNNRPAEIRRLARYFQEAK